ncbi:MAG: spike base protein, RCAP_Rcc01079 family [Paracoccaceae bacterium]
MTNPFENRTSSLAGPATDILPVVPDDATDMQNVAIALYVETGGSLSVVTTRGGVRSISVANNSILPVGIRRVNATGTTATGIHAMVIA